MLRAISALRSPFLLYNRLPTHISYSAICEVHLTQSSTMVRASTRVSSSRSKDALQAVEKTAMRKTNAKVTKKPTRSELEDADLKEEEATPAKRGPKRETQNGGIKEENGPEGKSDKKDLNPSVERKQSSPANKTTNQEHSDVDVKQEAASPANKSIKKALPNRKVKQEDNSPSAKTGKMEDDDMEIKEEEASNPTKATRNSRKRASTNTSKPSKKLKTEDIALPSPSSSTSASPPPSQSIKAEKTPDKKSADLQAKKLKSLAMYAKVSPFHDFPHPTPTEARLAHKILTSLHGARTRPTEVVASKTTAGCGDSPSVLDALVRTILSQNTSDANSTRAKLSMDKVYGGSDEWALIVKGGEAKLQEAIKCGGLSVVKSKVIISILRQVYEKYGMYSLDHLHEAETEEAYKEMLAFQGVGPKTASCVLLFCLKRESFAVDTHVWLIAGLLGWRPKEAGREATQAHLDIRIPGEEKYGLHILMVTHGKRCDECKAGGKSTGKCELRRAFRKEKSEKEEEIKGEEEVVVKDEKDKKRRGKKMIEEGAEVFGKASWE